MKREFLRELELEEEIIDKVMKEHGKTVNTLKDDLEVEEAKVKTLEENLKVANKQIEDFEELDVEEIQAEVIKYKEKLKETEAEAEEKIKQLKYEGALKEVAQNYKFTNERVKKSILDDLKEKEFKLDDGKLLGIEDYMNKLIEEEPNSFVIEGEEGKEEAPYFVRPSGQTSGKEITRKDFIKMPFDQKVQLKNTNKKLYDELTK